MPSIYHFTHRSNLESILRAGGLHCDSTMAAQGQHANVGNLDIKARRARRAVPVAVQGVVADYVPFYYATRSPMLYSIYRGGVPSCTYPQSEIVYLVCDSDAVSQSGPFCITDRNAVLAHAQFSARLADIATLIDWPLMRERIWRNTPDDTERVERRMAEFLLHSFVAWPQVQQVGVYDAANIQYVQNLLTGQQHIPPLVIQSGWYFP